MGRLQLAAEDMQEETVGQLLREIGDEINRQYELRVSNAVEPPVMC